MNLDDTYSDERLQAELRRIRLQRRTIGFNIIVAAVLLFLAVDAFINDHWLVFGFDLVLAITNGMVPFFFRPVRRIHEQTQEIRRGTLQAMAENQTKRRQNLTHFYNNLDVIVDPIMRAQLQAAIDQTQAELAAKETELAQARTYYQTVEEKLHRGRIHSR